MGNGMCSRKQKRIFQTLLLLTVVFGFLYGAMLYYELQAQLRKAEAVAQKYQQHQESLSAQLQGTVSGARRPAGNFAPSLPPGWESGFGEQFGIAGATSDLRGHQRRALQGRRVPSVRGLDIPDVRVPKAIPFGMGSTSPWTRWAADGHTDSCLPALTEGPVQSRQASQQPSRPFCQPIPAGHGSLLLATGFSFEGVSNPRKWGVWQRFLKLCYFFFSLQGKLSPIPAAHNE